MKSLLILCWLWPAVASGQRSISWSEPEEPPIDEGPDLVFVAGFDLSHSPVGENAPAFASFEMSVTTRTLQLGYAIIRSEVLAYPFNKGAEAIGFEGDIGLTQACFFCVSFGKRIARLAPQRFLTFGGHLERIQTGSAARYSVTGFGGEIGVIQRTGQLEVQARLGLQAMINDGYQGPRGWIDVRGAYALTSWLGVYAHLGYAYGIIEAPDGYQDYTFDGPVLQLGLGYMSR